MSLDTTRARERDAGRDREEWEDVWVEVGGHDATDPMAAGSDPPTNAMHGDAPGTVAADAVDDSEPGNAVSAVSPDDDDEGWSDVHGRTGLWRTRLLARTALRTLTYCFYDAASYSGRKDEGRVAKVLVECAIDEALPPMPVRGSQARLFSSYLSLASSASAGSLVSSSSSPSRTPRYTSIILQKSMEHLVPVAISSLLLNLHLRRAGGAAAHRNTARSALAVLFKVAYRVGRQAIICRFFFRYGTLPYTLLTLVAVVCSFFREEGLAYLFRVRQWPRFFCARQGARATLRAAVYAAVFCVPVRRLAGAWGRAAAGAGDGAGRDVGRGDDDGRGGGKTGMRRSGGDGRGGAEVRAAVRRRVNNLRKLVFFLCCILGGRAWWWWSVELGRRRSVQRIRTQ